jgi:hypothetical protein
MIALSEDGRLILTTFAEVDGPVDWWDMLSRLAPEPKRRLGFVRKAEYKAWLDRHNALIWAEIRLFGDGMLGHLPAPESNMTVITPAGREALAANALR